MKNQHVLVLGAGIAGLSTALMLAKSGVGVTVLEARTDWDIVGAGLTLSGPSFRAIEALGILQDVLEQGHAHPGIKVHDPQGRYLKTLISPAIHSHTGNALPGAGGILRSTLHHILLKHLNAWGAQVQMGLSCLSLKQVTSHKQSNACVQVVLSDGRELDVDAVVVAEGLFSQTRQTLFPASPPPTLTGQACWRLVIDRPHQVDHRFFYLGGSVKVGLTPVSAQQMYLFLLEEIAQKPKRDASELPVILKNLLAEFSGELRDIADGLHPTSHIVYRPLEAHLLKAPWHIGCIALVGDAAHATTPQLASGAAMAMEDGIVLAQEFVGAKTVHEAFERYFLRRYERCKMVVENSLKIGQLEVARASAVEQASVVETSLRHLAQPY